MKTINSFVVAHLSPDVLHFELSYNTADTQVQSVLNSVKWLWQELSADHSSDNLHLPSPVFHI